MKIFSSFVCGDLRLLYYRAEHLLTFSLIPASMGEQVVSDGKNPESMIQFKLSGTPFRSGMQYTLRNSPCIHELKFLSQKPGNDKVITRFQYGEGLFFDHVAELHDGWVRIWIEVRNQTGRVQKFDQLASFSLDMISPFQTGNGAGKYFLNRVAGRWHHEEISMERAGMEKAGSLRFGENGTMPVVEYYPFAGIEDRSSGVLWGAQLENSGAWMLEFASSGKGMSLSGGMPDRGFCGHGLSVAAGAALRTPSAVLTSIKGDILDLFNRLQKSMCSERQPEASPVYFGAFSEKTLQALRRYGIRYYVPDHDLNAEDLAKIESAGLIPGITLDAETVSAAGPETHLLLAQDGSTLQADRRGFIDFRDSERRNADLQKLCRNLKERRIGYVKFVCPASFCGGCDGNGSPLENQQQYTDAVFSFYAELRRKMPELMIELSTRGTGRFSAKWLTLADVVTSMDEFPDAALSMAALDRQMLAPGCKCGVNVTLHPGDDLHGKLNASLLGRLILSGDLAALSETEKKTLEQFLDFHRATLPVRREGSCRLGHIIGDSCMNPSGWQVFYKNTQTMQLIVIHTFSEMPEVLSFDIAAGMEKITDFSGKIKWHIHDQKLEINPHPFSASAAFLFAKTSC